MENNIHNQLLLLQKDLERYADTLTRYSSSSEDLVQTTLLKCLLYKDKFESGTNLKSWAMTIMRNEFINNFRQKKRRGDEPIELSNAVGLKDSSIDQTLEMKDILKSIDRMPAKFKDVIRLRIDGYKYNEIASMLNINIGTVKSRIFFARNLFLK